MRKVTDLIPTITIVLIVFGYVNVFEYFSLFGIDIYNYLEVSEIILSFSAIIYPIAVMSASLIYQIVKRTIEKSGNAAIITNELSTHKPSKKLIIKTSLSLIVAILIYIYFVYFNQQWQVSEKIFDTVGMFFCVFFPALYFMEVYVAEMPQKRNFTLNRYIFATFFMVGLYFFVLIRNHIRHDNIAAGSPKYDVQVIMKDPEANISTTNELLYVGATNKYLFFQNIKSKENLIISKQNVSVIKITQLRSNL